MTARIRRIAIALCASVMISGALTTVIAAGNGPDERGDEGPAVTFTKWITIDPGYPSMAGFTGGAAAGTFTGQVLDATTTIDGLITRLVAVYEVHSRSHSFTALIQGGADNLTGKAILDGVVLAGWKTGARAHVTFDAITCSEPNALNGICFRGTIRLTSGGEE